MQIVIDIPDTAYRGIITADHAGGSWNNDLLGVLCRGVANGIPLPKGHGRLIDVNDLLEDINLEDNDYNRDVNTGEIITLENIDRIPTVIEADTESEGENE